MNVCIISHDNFARFPAHYQIMQPIRCGFSQVFGSRMFTLAEAQARCVAEGFTVLAIGNTWQCSDYTL